MVLLVSWSALLIICRTLTDGYPAQLIAGGIWPILAASLIYAVESIDNQVQIGRHVGDGSVYFCELSRNILQVSHC